MIKVGIDSIAVYTSHYALDLVTLATARGVDPDKYHAGLGQRTMSVPPPGEDIVTMAANAGKQALQDMDVNDVEMLLFATESGIDQSKAAGIYVHDLLDLPARCRVVELKQACYSATAALQLTLPYLRENPTKKVLLIASDIAKYGLNTVGESSQGSGAVAMVLSTNPRVLAFDPECGMITESIMDFWRPNYMQEALVEGKYSSKMYLSMLEKTWDQYHALSGRGFADHTYYCYHTPVPRLVEKAHHSLVKFTGNSHLSPDVTQQQIDDALEFGRRIGNSYTASLYVGLASLLDLAKQPLDNQRIGFYSYGSGCVAEFFSGVVQAGYRDVLHTEFHANVFKARKLLSYEEYETFYRFQYVEDGSTQTIPLYETGLFRLGSMQQHKRMYEKVSLHVAVDPTDTIHHDATSEGAERAKGMS